MYNIQEHSTEAISWTRRMIWERMILHLETKHTQTWTREHAPATDILIDITTRWLTVAGDVITKWLRHI